MRCPAMFLRACGNGVSVFEKASERTSARHRRRASDAGGRVRDDRWSGAGPASRRCRAMAALPLFLTAIGSAIVGGIGVWQLMPAPGSAPRKVVRFALPTSAGIAPRGTGVGRHVLAISPQGSHLVYWRTMRCTCVRWTAWTMALSSVELKLRANRSFRQTASGLGSSKAVNSSECQSVVVPRSRWAPR